MALTKCKECGHEISKKAKACPKCGAPHKPKGFTLPAKVGLVIVVLIALSFALTDKPGPSTTSTKPAAKNEPALDCSTQAKRQEFIQKMVNEGLWQKIERPATLYHVYVMPSFMAEATFDDKEQFMSVVSAYSQCAGGEDLVVIYDAMTGKKIGDFSNLGLDLD